MIEIRSLKFVRERKIVMQIAKFRAKIKIFKFGTRTSYVSEYFLILKALVIYKINTLELVKLQNFVLK